MGSHLDAPRAAMQAGRLGEAESLARGVVLRRPHDAAAVTLLGIILFLTAKPVESVKHLKRGCELERSSAAALIPLAGVLLQLDHLDEAAEAAHQATLRAPGSAEAFSLLGLALMRLGRMEEARVALAEARRLDPNSVSTLNLLAAANEKLGLSDDAEEARRDAVRLAPADTESRAALATQVISHGRLQEATDLLRDGLDLNPDSPVLLLLQGQAMLAAGGLGGGAGIAEEGELYVRRSLELDPKNASGLLMLALRCESLGRFEEARTLLERSIEVEPNQGKAYFELVQGGRVSEAQRGLVEAMERAAQGGSLSAEELPFIRYALGKAYDDLDDVVSAMENYDQANRLSLEAYARVRPFDRESYGETLSQTKQLFTPEILRQAQPGAVASPKPIFIVGVMRSGTSLVEQIVTSHPKVFGCGELQYWLGTAATTYKMTRRLPTGDEVAAIARGYSELLGSLAPGGAPFATDKMPHNYEVLGLIHLAFPEAPIIYVKRHPVDTCLSIYMTAYGTPPEFAFDKANIAHVYSEHLTLMDHWRSALPPGRILELSYEELVADPEPIVRRLVEYCGLEWDDACLRPEQNERVVNTPSRWQVRQQVYTSSVARWRRYQPWLGEFANLLEVAPSTEARS